MRTVRTTVAALGVASLVSLSAGTASAQTAEPAATSGGLDPFWLMAVGAGAVAGVVVATVVTDGLILPVYAWAAAGEGGMMAAGGARAAMTAGGHGGAAAARGAAGGMAAAEGGGAAMAAGTAAEGGAAAGGAGMAGGSAAGNSTGAATMHGWGMHGWSGTMLFRRGMQALGAITGGMVGSDMYGG